MKKLFFLLPLLYLSACSPINSVAPFDDKQAAVLTKQMYGTHATAAKTSSIS